MKSVTSKIRIRSVLPRGSSPRRRWLSAAAAMGGASLLTRPNGAIASAGARPIKPPLQVGFVYVSPIGEAGWTTQHDRARLQVEKALGDKVRTRFVANVAEGPDAERVIRDLAAQGSQLIFTTSFGYMEPTLRVAREFPDVVFEHATGYKTAPNVGTYNARFYEGRYLAGLIAGRMTRSSLAGYVAAFPIPEVLQGINAFTLGMRATNPKAELKIVWTNAWFDPGKEKEAALALINQGCDVLTHHTDSTAVVSTAEEKGRQCIGYHSDMSAFGLKAHLAAVTHHWGAYCTQVARQVLDGTWKSTTVWGGIKDGFIRLEGLSAALPADLKSMVRERSDDIAAGRFHPFSGRIADNEGRVRHASGPMTDEQLNKMDFHVQGVQGKPPGR